MVTEFIHLLAGHDYEGFISEINLMTEYYNKFLPEQIEDVYLEVIDDNPFFKDHESDKLFLFSKNYLSIIPNFRQLPPEHNSGKIKIYPLNQKIVDIEVQTKKYPFGEASQASNILISFTFENGSKVEMGAEMDFCPYLEKMVISYLKPLFSVE